MHPSALAYLLRSRLALPTLHHVAGVFEGAHISRRAGQSQDFLDLVPYQIGDDVSTIDWKTTARMGEPIIKRFEHHSLATMMLGVDCGKTMAALAPPWSDYDVYTGRSTMTKAAIASEIVEVFSHLALLRGDKVGMIAGNSAQVTTHVARHGKAHIQRMISDMQRMMTPHSGSSTLPAVLRRLRIVAQQPTVVLVITDNSVPDPRTIDELRKLRQRHWVGVITVPDANAAAISPSDMTPGSIVDVEDGLTAVGYFSNDRQLVDEYNSALYHRHNRMLQAYNQARVELISLTTRAQLPAQLIHTFSRYRSGSTL